MPETTKPVAPDVDPVIKAPVLRLQAADIVISVNILMSKRYNLYFDVLLLEDDPAVPLLNSKCLALAYPT